MVAVDHDLAGRVGDGGQGGADVGLPHVHHDFVDRSFAFVGQFGPERVQCGFPAVVTHPEHAPTLKIGDHRHVLVPLLEAGLVNAQHADRLIGPTGQTAFHRALQDPLRLVPAQAHQPRQARNRRLPKQPDRHRFEQSRESAPVLGPRYPDRPNPVLRTLHPRDPGAQHRSVLAGVQMAPAPLRGAVVARDALLTLRTAQLRPFLQPQTDPNLALPW